MRALSFLLFTLACGILMALFIVVPGIFRYLFSLIAVLVGSRFFRSFESRLARGGFITAVVIISLLLAVIYVPLAIYNGWPLGDQLKPR